MNLKTFTTLIEGIERYNERKYNVYKLGIDVLGFDEDYYREVIRPLFVEVFTKEGLNWIEWYLYERSSVTGEKLKAFDKDGNEICYDISSLYDTVKKHLK